MDIGFQADWRALRATLAPQMLCTIPSQCCWVLEQAMIYEPLEEVTRPVLDTAAAAHYLYRRPQTMRGWACHEDGPIKPIRINGRLAWRTSDVKAVLGLTKGVAE
jgi:hypothetical protein